MSGPLTRTLNFKSSDLGQNVTLVLTFDSEEIPGIYRDVYPIAFKVADFKKKGDYNFQFTYKSQLGLTRALISSKDEVEWLEPASNYIRINVGKKTSLTKDGNYYFTEATPTDIKPSEQIVAKNDTTEKQNIGFGLFAGSSGPPSPVLLFKDVGPTSSAQIQFTPVLRGYLTTAYREAEIMRYPVVSPVFFSRDLTQLEEETNWEITYNPGSGVRKINKI